MSGHLNPRRESARGFFEALERALQADEVLSDKRCVRLIVEKAEAEQRTRSRKRFDAGAAFRNKVLYGTVDEMIAAWCRRHDLRADPYTVFRYGGAERGPTQHETGMGSSLPFVERVFDRLAADVPEIEDCRIAVAKKPNQAITPGLRLQHPLPFGAAGEVVYDGKRRDLDRSVYLVALYVATGGDPSRGWRYDCGLIIFYTPAGPGPLLGTPLAESWPDVRERIWRTARVWVTLL
jgi:hypothetical protein